LKANYKKSNYIIFKGRAIFENFTELSFNLTLDGQPVNRVNTLKILGLNIDEGLNFAFHLNKIKPSLIAFVNAFRRIRNLISLETAYKMYFAYFYSKLSYMNIAWFSTDSTTLRSIEILHRIMLRLLLFNIKHARLCHNKDLYSEKLLPFQLVNNFSLIIMAFKLKHNLIKHNFHLRFVHNRSLHSVRNANDFAVPRIETSFGHKNPLIRSMILFNQLPRELKCVVSLKVFKTRLKEHIFESVNDYLR
jgi:hypothetical protein